MKVGKEDYRSIWHDERDPRSVHVIDQRALPFTFDVMTLRNAGDVCDAISCMAVRGAPLIGAAAAWGVYLSFLEHSAGDDVYSSVMKDSVRLKATRPTAVNLTWAVDYMTSVLKNSADAVVMRRAAISLCDMEAERSRSIGMHGLPLIEEISRNKKEEVVNILTHCNAGWLACVDYGTALAPVYLAHDSGIKVHVWVDETRPRNQGSRLTAWELSNHGVPCTLITDNAGGHLMQHGMVDIAIVGCDRATASGDVANKIGTYLKALAAHDNGVPFYAALPVSTFDMSIDSPGQIEIEERDGNEVRIMSGMPKNTKEEHADNANPESSPSEEQEVYICHPDLNVANYGFDVTPARLITGLITDRGICQAEKKSILKLLS